MSVLEFYRRNSSIHYSIAEDALHLGLAECERLREQLSKAESERDKLIQERNELDEAKEERDQLLQELVRIFKWEDPSFLHAILHVENAIKNTWADLAVEKGRTKRASLAALTSEEAFRNMRDDRDALALEIAKREAHIEKIEDQSFQFTLMGT